MCSCTNLCPGCFQEKTMGQQGQYFISVFEPQYGQRSVQWAIKRAGQLAGITKPLSVHSLRHTYATHLLEDGVNILTIQQMLGHAHVRTTMLYPHVAQINNHQKCSPLDTLEGLKVIGTVQGMLDFDWAVSNCGGDGYWWLDTGYLILILDAGIQMRNAVFTAAYLCQAGIAGGNYFLSRCCNLAFVILSRRPPCFKNSCSSVLPVALTGRWQYW